MLKKISTFLCLLACASLLFSASASTAYKTYSIDRNKSLVETPVAYIPSFSIASWEGETLSNASDIAVTETCIYICDTGNSRVLAGQEDGHFVKSIGTGILKKPTGIYVDTDDSHTLYVADQEAEKVFVFSQTGELLREYARPTESLFGTGTAYVPVKVAVNENDSIFIVSEGNTNGLIQLSKESGEFLGYFGANQTIVSLWQRISSKIFTENQKNQTNRNLPPSPTNVTADKKGLVYALTGVSGVDTVRKLNVSGANTLSDTFEISNPSDIAVSKQGFVYVCTTEGYLFELTSDGTLLFAFGGQDDSSQRKGLFKSASAIAVDGANRLYVLDSETNELQVFTRTEFSERVHTALTLYQEGKYLESRQPWQAVLARNDMFQMAHIGIGKAQLKNGEYKEAIRAFKLANDKEGYSEAFGELRNQYIKSHIVLILVCLLAAAGVVQLLKLFKRKRKMPVVSTPVKSGKLKSFARQILFAGSVPKHPANAYYGIKHEGKTSLASSTALYMLFCVIFVVERYGSGFIFKTVPQGRFTAGTDFIITLGVLMLIAVCGYLISSVSSGEARFQDIYSGTIYACAPYFILKPLRILLSLVLTYNEVFIIRFLDVFIIAACLVLYVVMIRELNNYSYTQTLKNVALTMFSFAVAAAALFIIYVLCKQFAEFALEFINEVRYRVFG